MHSVRTVAGAGKEAGALRPPRVIRPDHIIRPYSQYDALGFKIFNVSVSSSSLSIGLAPVPIRVYVILFSPTVNFPFRTLIVEAYRTPTSTSRTPLSQRKLSYWSRMRSW